MHTEKSRKRLLLLAFPLTACFFRLALFSITNALLYQLSYMGKRYSQLYFILQGEVKIDEEVENIVRLLPYGKRGDEKGGNGEDY